MNPALSHLPDFLVKEGGLNNGFMIAHCTASSLVSENKTLSYPASVDSKTTSIIAIELMARTQAFDLLRPLKSTSKIEKIYSMVRNVVPFMDKDYVFNPHIESI